MSSRTVEREIVQMEFDARKFAQGIDSAGRDLNSFKRQFDMTYQQKGLMDLERTADGISFDGMTSGVQQVAASFSALQVIGFTVLNRLTNAAIDLGKKLVSAIAIDPVKTGLEEYETQLNAVQTIMANTAKSGTTLDDVNSALDELNEYADLTIYNFTEMTSAIGRFTTAGVDLDTSVQAIKGLSNVAALSGANAQEAARGQYQLSQALSSGVIRLQDWMSIETANMGGQIFRDSLIETAKIHGINVDKMIEKHGSFRLSLQEQWLSSEIMLETLSKFTGELSDQDLLALGYNEEQIASIQKTATLALDAAQKIKTVTQLIGVLKEALQSGWAQSWRTIIGDFEEAKEFWGKIGEIITIPIEKSADERNKQLSFWAQAGGRQEVVDALIKTLWSGLRILTAFQEVINDVFGSIKAGQLLAFSSKISELADNFAYVTMHLGGFKDTLRGLFGGLKSIGEGVLNIVKALVAGITDVFEPIQGSQIVKMAEGFKALADRFKEGTENLGPFRRIVSGIAAALDIALRFIVAFIGPLSELINHVGKGSSGFWNWLAAIADSIVAWREMIIETNLFNRIAAKVVEFIKKIADRIHMAVDAFMELEVIQDVKEWLTGLGKEDWIKVWDAFLAVLQAIIAPFYLVAQGVKWLAKELYKLEVVKKVVAWFEALNYEKIKTFFKDISASTREFFDSIKNSEIISKFVEYINTFDGRRFTTFQRQAGENFSWLTGIVEALKEKMAGLDFSGISDGLGELGGAVKKAIAGALDWLIENAGNIDYSAVFKAINTGLFAGILLALRKIASGEFLSGVFGEDSPLGSIRDSLVETLGGVQGVLTAYQTNIKADTLQKIAIAIAVFAASIFLLTLVDQAKLTTVSIAIAGMLATLFGSSAILGKINTKDAAKAAVAIIAISVALSIAAYALSKISNLSGEEIKRSLAAMAAGLTGLVVAVNTIQAGKGTAKSVIALLGIVTTLLILSAAVRSFGSMDPEVLTQGLLGIGTAMGILVTAIALLKQVGDKGLLTTALTIGDMAISLVILAQAVEKFGAMEPDQLIQGLLVVGAALAGFAAYSRIVNPQGMIKAAIGMTIVSVALLILAQAIQVIGGINREELIQGLLGMGAAMLMMVLAANLMTGAIGGAFAMLIMSVAITAMAAALKIIGSMSLEQLLIALAGLAGVFIILGLAGLILGPIVPILLALGAAMLIIGLSAALLGVGVFLAATGLVALAAAAGAIAAAIGVIGLAVVEILPALATAFAEAFVNFFVTIGENTPRLVEAFKQIILGMITGLTELIPDIVVAILAMITALLTAIGEEMPTLVQAGYDILLAFIEGIEENIADIVEAGLGVLTEFINGLAEGIPDLVTAAFELILSWLTAIDEAIVEYTPLIVEKGIAIAGHLITGIAQGILGGFSIIKQAVLDLAQAALDALGLGWLIKSPSEATYRAAEMAVRGIVLAFYDGEKSVRDAMLALTQQALDGLKPLEKAMINAIENDWALSPIITPVVDLDNLSQGAALANSLFRDVRLGTGNYDDSYQTDRAGSITPRDSEGNVTFVQHIHSPKALDNATIYRQTRTLVATRSRKAFEI